MQEQRFDELEQRAAAAANIDSILKMEAQARVHAEIEKMKEEGKALVLSAEEEDMLHAFRRFKLRMRKDGEMFSWQTRRPEGIQVVQETAEIVYPQETA